MKTALIAISESAFETRGAWSEELQRVSDEHATEWRLSFLTWQQDVERFL